MKKHTIFFIIVLPCLLLCCKTLETYIDNSNDDYTVIPIVKTSWLIIKTVMEDYSLVYKENDDYESDFMERKIRKYIFNKNGVLVYNIEIVSIKNGIRFTNGGFLFGKRELYIRIINKNGIKKEYVINENEYPYLVFQEDIDEIIKIIYYESKNKNDIESKWTYHTGFKIFVNNQEYGILALYPTVFYRKNDIENMVISNKDNLALYILATYASYLCSMEL
jgi:hypothetical protein